MSHYDRGQCTKCHFVFSAIEEYGDPPGLDLEELYRHFATVSEEKSDKLIACLTERIDEIPPEPAEYSRLKGIEEYEQRHDIWKLEVFFVSEELKRGGELWRWVYSRECLFSSGIAVVRDNKVVAEATYSCAIGHPASD
ncbi:MAG: hypothetical protein JW818_10365 [Pirellulales bacterium]|nr:hypothetical protein [Pirellulales bacterium]